MSQRSRESSDSPTDDVVIGLGAGRPLRLLGLSPAQAESVHRAWRRCPPPQDAVPTVDVRWSGSAQEPSGAQWDAFHEMVAQTAAREVITGGLGRSLMLHAAAVADASGRALVLSAPSGTGKTTGSIALGRRWGYLTDETVVIDPQALTIDPFPKPLSVLEPGGQRPKRQHGPDDLGLLLPMDSRLHAIGVLRRRDPSDPRPPELIPLPLHEALAHLIPQTSSLSVLERGLVTLIRVLEQAGGAWALDYTDSDGLTRLAEQLLAPQDAAAPEPEPFALWRAVPVEDLRPAQTPAPESEMVRAAAVDDAVVLDSAQGPVLLVLQGESFSTLGGIGPHVWDGCRDWTSPDALAARLAEQPGAPQDAAQRVLQAIDELIGRGVLERSA